jgi:hypothetical protein
LRGDPVGSVDDAVEYGTVVIRVARQPAERFRIEDFEELEFEVAARYEHGRL